MSQKSDNQMLAYLGTPEGFGLAEGCTRKLPYESGCGEDSHNVNRSIERNNTAYGPRWMGWADE